MHDVDLIYDQDSIAEVGYLEHIWRQQISDLQRKSVHQIFSNTFPGDVIEMIQHFLYPPPPRLMYMSKRTRTHSFTLSNNVKVYGYYVNYA